MLALLCTPELALAPSPHPRYTTVLVSEPTTPAPYNASSTLDWAWHEQRTGRSRLDWTWLKGDDYPGFTNIETCVDNPDKMSQYPTLIKTLIISWSTAALNSSSYRPPQEAVEIFAEMVGKCSVFTSAPVCSQH